MSQTALVVPLRATHGVVTLFGYGIRVHVDHGHLIFEDGIGEDRRVGRFSRVGHNLRRLVVVGSDGVVSLAALRWLADQDAAFVMLDRNGSVLATTGPVCPSDARLRRAQAIAHQSGVALQISRELIERKLLGQERVVSDGLNNSSVAQSIAHFRSALANAESILAIRQLESQAAQAYWYAWNKMQINFPKIDIARVPDHWRIFGTRKSCLTGSPRLAVNPANAMLNYLYALLESEARLAIAALGLDPGLGVLHADTPSRDSLACDIMEAVRPDVDAYLLDWLQRQPIKREWFFEQRDGNCRLMAPLAVRLAETASVWARAVAPFAESMVKTLWSSMRKPSRQLFPATRLTQSRRRQAKGASPIAPAKRVLAPPGVCQICGAVTNPGHRYCSSCSPAVSRENLIKVAKLGRLATHTPTAEERRAETQRRQKLAERSWKPADLPSWLNERAYSTEIKPRLTKMTVPAISQALGISKPYATDIRAGRRIPHPRHWLALACAVGFSSHE